MTSLVPFRSERAEPYLTAAFVAARSPARMRPLEEIERLKQTIALRQAGVDLETSYPLPPEDSPFRAAVARAVKQMQVDSYVLDQDGKARRTCPPQQHAGRTV